MSISCDHYVVWGWRLPYIMEGVDFDDAKFLPYEEGHKGVKFRLIRDGMSGEYTVFGAVLAETEDTEDFAFTEICPSNFPTGMFETYAQLFDGPPAEVAKLFIFSHYH